MAGLSDMEELVATVPERDIANYLREALVCYGAGAYRGCIVLTHIALFEGLRQKLLALAPVNSTARTVSNVIEPLAASQKVFELTLVHQMKTAAIITQLESDILEQLNRQRNKAAHPSGHIVTAEEARFVFSEAIQKFLSKAIRQTSVVVDGIVLRIAGPNFFPSAMTTDMDAIVSQETQNLDPTAVPQLVAKLTSITEVLDPVAARNARLFLLSLAGRQEAAIRTTITKEILDAKSTNNGYAELVAMLVARDPRLLESLTPGTRIRVNALLLTNANAVGLNVPYAELRNPARVLGASINVLGETYMRDHHKDFVDWVIGRAPYSPEFIRALQVSPGLMGELLSKYRQRASHSQWNESNAFAASIPAMDEPLARAVSDGDAFRILAAVVKGAEWSGFGPMEIANGRFTILPNLKAKAVAFSSADPAAASTAINEVGLSVSLPVFAATYF